MSSQYNLKDLATDGINGVIKQGIGSVPVIGGFILGALNGIEQKRATGFLNDLVEIIKYMEEQKFDKEYFQTEEFADILIQATRARVQHRSKEKAEVLLQLINDCLCNDRSERYEADFKEVFIGLIDHFTQSEMIFLADFSKGLYQEKCKSDVYKSKQSSIPIAFDGLVSKGLFKDDSTLTQHLKLTKLGEEFLDYLKYLNKY